MEGLVDPNSYFTSYRLSGLSYSELPDWGVADLVWAEWKELLWSFCRLGCGKRKVKVSTSFSAVGVAGGYWYSGLLDFLITLFLSFVEPSHPSLSTGNRLAAGSSRWLIGLPGLRGRMGLSVDITTRC